ncbi:MAG: FliG C-terminal domain-containing protein [Planctomycetota bacterium]|jgi:flagellar motor switch protein FliG
MAFSGKQKAAMLLMSLDTLTAVELLKGLDADEIQEIAIELARIDASGQRDVKEQSKIIREFCNSLNLEQNQKFSVRSFLNEMLVNVLDKERIEQIHSQVKIATEKKDVFLDIRLASTDELVLALDGEHPQTIAVVLSELSTKKSQEVLSLLSEEARLKAVCKMTNPEMVGGGVKQRMAATVTKRLKSFKGETVVERPEQALRKLALVLSGLERDMRDQMLAEIGKNDEETAAMVKRLMITWEDIPSVADRSLQDALRSVDAGKLALALHGADEDIAQKIRSNMSDRAVSLLDEEISLMQEPLDKEVLNAREEVVRPLREANEEGTLRVTGR